ncbi:UNVERIFIED_CONTAM: hypothetical protein Slati_0429800 [Sesamum latifolium]|uniref:Uncharacterized protein n=1 Tax=Sesamum latifolium TaxID=2727402 RepID=A0AAW2XZ55_9LAMI
MSLEDIVKSLALTNLQFQQDTKSGLQDIKAGLQEMRVELQETRANLQETRKLPIQIDTHPIENMSVMALRGEKEIHTIEQEPTKAKEDEKTLESTKAQNKKVESDLSPPPLSNTCALPFSYRMSKSNEDEKKILNTLIR